MVTGQEHWAAKTTADGDVVDLATHDGTFVADNPAAGIAKAAGPAGDFLYRFGDPARYAQGEPPRILENWDSATSGHKQMGGAHDVHWIRPGLPGHQIDAIAAAEAHGALNLSADQVKTPLVMCTGPAAVIAGTAASVAAFAWSSARRST